MSLKEKRIRSINWDEEEKQLFRSVLKEYATIIENKSLDNTANKLKTKAWEEVHKKFNELNGRLRSLNQLKIQWKTMKINARKEVSLFKRATNKTGGGGRPQTPTDLIEINDLLNPAELLRDENIYDSDGIIISASTSKDTSKDLSASQTCIFTSQDITENILQPDITICENIYLGKHEEGSTSVITVVEDHIAAASQETKNYESTVSQESKDHEIAVSQKSIASIILQDNTADAKIQVKNNMDAITPKNIFKHIKKTKKSSKSPSCFAKSNNYVDTMVNYSKNLKDQEHKKRLEILEVELNIQKEKLKSAILEREILEIKKMKELT